MRLPLEASLWAKRAAAGAGPDNDHIEMVLRGHFRIPFSGSECCFNALARHGWLAVL